MSAPSHERVTNLLGAHALEALEDEEARDVIAHLSVCPRCCAELRRLREAVGLLMSGPDELPVDAKERIWARIRQRAAVREMRPFLELVEDDECRDGPE